MNILCIECATELCSVSLLTDGEVIFTEQSAPRKHNELILQLASDLLTQKGLKNHQLSAVAFGRGPGAFTGVRIAASAAQGIALALELPIIPVSTLDILAQKVLDLDSCDYAMPIMDARMEEVYWTVCKRDADGVSERVTEEKVSAPDMVTLSVDGDIAGIGSGWSHYPELKQLLKTVKINHANAEELPSAVQLAKIAQREWQHKNFVPPEQALPVYIRDNVVARSMK